MKNKNEVVGMMGMVGKMAGAAFRASVWGVRAPMVEGPRISVCAC